MAIQYFKILDCHPGFRRGKLCCTLRNDDLQHFSETLSGKININLTYIKSEEYAKSLFD
jgi:hypothetical protein